MAKRNEKEKNMIAMANRIAAGGNYSWLERWGNKVAKTGIVSSADCKLVVNCLGGSISPKYAGITESQLDDMIVAMSLVLSPYAV